MVKLQSTSSLGVAMLLNCGNALLGWIKIQRIALAWSSELEWIENNVKGRSASTHIQDGTAACVYHIWHDRNCRIVRTISTTPEKVVRLVFQDVICIATVRHKLAAVINDLNYYPHYY
ncbi:hypothetical protein P3L10_019406 [Capsicum annuum]